MQLFLDKDYLIAYRLRTLFSLEMLFILLIFLIKYLIITLNINLSISLLS